MVLYHLYYMTHTILPPCNSLKDSDWGEITATEVFLLHSGRWQGHKSGKNGDKIWKKYERCRYSNTKSTNTSRLPSVVYYGQQHQLLECFEGHVQINSHLYNVTCSPIHQHDQLILTTKSTNRSSNSAVRTSRIKLVTDMQAISQHLYY